MSHSENETRSLDVLISPAVAKSTTYFGRLIPWKPNLLSGQIGDQIRSGSRLRARVKRIPLYLSLRLISRRINRTKPTYDREFAGLQNSETKTRVPLLFRLKENTVEGRRHRVASDVAMMEESLRMGSLLINGQKK